MASTRSIRQGQIEIGVLEHEGHEFAALGATVVRRDLTGYIKYKRGCLHPRKLASPSAWPRKWPPSSPRSTATATLTAKFRLRASAAMGIRKQRSGYASSSARGQTLRFAAEDQHVAPRKGGVGVDRRGVLGKEPGTTARQPAQQCRPVVHRFPIEVLPVVEAGAAETAILQAETQRTHQPQLGPKATQVRPTLPVLSGISGW